MKVFTSLPKPSIYIQKTDGELSREIIKLFERKIRMTSAAVIGGCEFANRLEDDPFLEARIAFELRKLTDK